jgi:hypothetical protein
MPLRAWHAAIPVFLVAAVMANLPDDCASPAAQIRLASCVRSIEYREVLYEAVPTDRPIAPRLLLPKRDAVEPGCDDAIFSDRCGRDRPPPPSRLTTVRTIRGFDPGDLLWAADEFTASGVLLVPLSGQQAGYLLTPHARRFLNHHLDRRVRPKDFPSPSEASPG